MLLLQCNHIIIKLVVQSSFSNPYCLIKNLFFLPVTTRLYHQWNYTLISSYSLTRLSLFIYYHQKCCYSQPITSCYQQNTGILFNTCDVSHYTVLIIILYFLSLYSTDIYASYNMFLEN